MPTFNHFRTIDTGSISAGASIEKTWVPDEDYIIHKIMMFDTAGSTIRNVDVTMVIDGQSLTRDIVPAFVFDGKSHEVPILDIPIAAKKTLRIAIKNNETAARSIRIVLEIWK